jgi:hypothetical protein
MGTYYLSVHDLLFPQPFLNKVNPQIPQFSSQHVAQQKKSRAWAPKVWTPTTSIPVKVKGISAAGCVIKYKDNQLTESGEIHLGSL